MSDWMRGCDAELTGSTVQGGPFEDITIATINMLFGPRAPIEVAPGVFTGWVDPQTGQRVDFHYGIDLGAPEGTPLLALGYGKVVNRIDWDASFGNAITCEYPGDDGYTYKAIYLHMTAPSAIAAGDPVTPGQVLGYVGTTGASTGPHLHMQVWRNDYTIDPLTVLVEANPVGHVPPAPTPIATPPITPPMVAFNYVGPGPEAWMHDWELRIASRQPAPNVQTTYLGRQLADEVYRIRIEDW